MPRFLRWCSSCRPHVERTPESRDTSDCTHRMRERSGSGVPQFTEMRRPALWDGSRPAPRTVAVGYDGSQAARRALLCAVDAARPGGHVVVVTATPHADAKPLRLLEEAAAQLAGRGVRVSAHIGEGDRAEALVQVARETHAELIVVTPSR